MIRELIEDGMRVGYPDTAPFIEQTESVYRDFYGENEWAEDLVARIRAAGTEEREPRQGETQNSAARAYPNRGKHR